MQAAIFAGLCTTATRLLRCCCPCNTTLGLLLLWLVASNCRCGHLHGSATRLRVSRQGLAATDV